MIINNLRCCKEVKFNCDSLVGLIGKNNVGKSTIIEGIKSFFRSSKSYNSDDYYDSSKAIKINLIFHKLHTKELEQFKKYYYNNELSLTRIESIEGSIRFIGVKKQIPEFIEIRKKKLAPERIKAYRELYKNAIYENMPEPDTAWGRLEIKMQEFEEGFSEEETELTDSEISFIQNTPFGDETASETTKIIYIPSFYDISSETIHTRGIIQRIFNDYINSCIEDDKEFQEKLEKVENEIDNLYRKKRRPLHSEFMEKLNNSLKTYTVDLQCSIDIDEIKSNIRFPQPRITFEDQYIKTNIEKQGMGTQRSILFGLFNFWTQITHELSNNSSDLQKLDIIMLIEEPEIYMHPSKCKYLFNLFTNLTESEGSNSVNFQIIYTTHSSYFLNIIEYNFIKLIRKKNNSSEHPLTTIVSELDKEFFIKKYCKEFSCDSSVVTNQSIWIRHLSKISNSFNEGFFANKIILVEGRSDLSYYYYLQSYLKYDFNHENICFIKVDGKEKLKYIHFLYSLYNIPIFIIWDGDIHNKGNVSAKSAQKNKELLKIIGEKEKDFPDNSVYDKGAIFKDTIEEYIKAELGDTDFNKIRKDVVDKFNLHGYDNLEKNSEFAYNLIERIYSEGKKLPFLEEIIHKIAEKQS
ncbi:MAG: AAA family ATPase [Candidatus Lokiarchaeota archaeon]|nr:AAA family ATPase [Candidatus Lokiarchaeota archaeon]